MKKKLVVLTGAGISAESGISTFRTNNGLWDNHKVEDVASIEGWYRNPQLVLDFYNERRLQLGAVKPNAAHYALAELEKEWDVTVITQNVDNLHERAGSTRIFHLHGQLTKVRPENCCNEMDDYSEETVFDIGYDTINLGISPLMGHSFALILSGLVRRSLISMRQLTMSRMLMSSLLWEHLFRYIRQLDCMHMRRQIHLYI